MPSPRTPRGSRLQRGQRTPRAGTDSEVDTPMRDGSSRNLQQDSDAISVAATSPGSHLTHPSPYHAGGLDISDIDLSSPLNYGTPSSIGSIRTPGIRGTPLRMRPDIRTDKRIRQVNIGPEPVSGKKIFLPRSVTQPISPFSWNRSRNKLLQLVLMALTLGHSWLSGARTLS